LINLFAGMPKDHQLVLDTNWLHYNQITVTGAFGSTPRRLREAAMAAEGTIDLSELVTHHYPISQIEQAVIATEKYYGLRTVINKF
jgi:L-iditol 2-dehydrogenase